MNGIRAALGKNALDWAFAQQPDALCLQEVTLAPRCGCSAGEAREEQLNAEQRTMLKLPFASNAAQRPGYSGVITSFKQKPDQIVMGMGADIFDVEGRVIQTVEAGLRLFNIYFPNDSLHKKGENLSITGDFNTAHSRLT